MNNKKYQVSSSNSKMIQMPIHVTCKARHLMVEQGPLGEQDYEQLGDLVSCCEEQHVAEQLQRFLFEV